MDRDFSQVEHDLLKRSHQIATLKECFAWIEECNGFIKQLEECNVKHPRFFIGYRQSLIATIACLESTKTKLERRFLHFSDYRRTSNNSDNNVEKSFVWRKINAAFENRILIGAVINLDYTVTIFKRHQQCSARASTIERLNCIKVNTIFNGG